MFGRVVITSLKEQEISASSLALLLSYGLVFTKKEIVKNKAFVLFSSRLNMTVWFNRIPCECGKVKSPKLGDPGRIG